MRTSVRRAAPETYRDLSERRSAKPPARIGYVLAISGALAVVTFTLVYLATFAYAPGF